MESVAGIPSQLGCLKHKPAADMKEDETCHNRGVAQNPGASLRLHWHIGRESKVLGANEESANNQTDHPDQDTRGQEVRQPVERPPRATARGKRHKALQHINEVNQKIEDKTVENQCMKEGNNGPRLEHGLLGEDDPQRMRNSLAEIIQTRISSAASNGSVNIIKPNSGKIE